MADAVAPAPAAAGLLGGLVGLGGGGRRRGQGGGGLFGKLLQGGKRLLTGESFFVTLFANHGRARTDVAFASPTPGKIVPLVTPDLSADTVSSCEISSPSR